MNKTRKLLNHACETILRFIWKIAFQSNKFYGVAFYLQVQRKWMYLESIFVGSDDIRHQLPEEAKRFDNIDRIWKKIMAETAKNPIILDACTTPDRLATLSSLFQQLETCQKCLSEYVFQGNIASNELIKKPSAFMRSNKLKLINVPNVCANICRTKTIEQQKSKWWG